MNIATIAQPLALRPHDVCVGLQLLLSPEVSFRELALSVGLSLGETHNSAMRLQVAHLLMPHRRTVNVRPFVEFLVHGVPYAFPGQLGPETQGVPTAHSGPAFRSEIESPETVVWPSLEGEARGSALAPLCPAAPRMLKANPPLYRLLTIVDALRVGGSREKNLAQRLLEQEIPTAPSTA